MSIQRRAVLPSMLVGLVWVLSFLGLQGECHAQFPAVDLEEQPLVYSKTSPSNRVTRLIAGIERGQAELEYEPERAYLSSLLKHLEISETSQVLVFSKTSLQIRSISPRNPRAIYFNDDTYVGTVPGSSLVEISTNDPKLGAAFYSFQMSASSPRIRHETYQCLACHATSMTKGVPGHAVRSGYPNYDGIFDSKMESFVTDDTSDFKQRWGGWYVSGSHGDLRHMGNTYLRGGVFDSKREGNRQSLEDLFNVGKYLSPHSDIQALMVLEHQTQMHNEFTKADFSLRVLDHQNSNQDPAARTVHIQSLAKGIVDRLLFCKEFPLTSPVAGTSGFAQEFSQRGPRDAVGRSLREFDMQTRMFKYPLSYLIYSDGFDGLQPALRDQVCAQLSQVLNDRNQADEYRHLSPELRQQMREIVLATKPGILREVQP